MSNLLNILFGNNVDVVKVWLQYIINYISINKKILTSKHFKRIINLLTVLSILHC